MGKKAKEKRGITLMVLIITVILMLILAGVAVSTITTEGVPFGKMENIAGKYNDTVEERQKAINNIIEEMNEDYIEEGSGGDGNSGGNANPGGNDDNNDKKSDGSYDTNAKVNSPDTSKLPEDTTKYVTWDNYTEQIHETVPEDWYNYNNGQWANIKSTANGLEAYWVWIPRFAYKLPESSTAKEIEVIFIKGTGKTGVLADGTEVECYYATDTEITTDGSGLYSKKATGAEEKWIVHPAFWWDDDSDEVMDEGEQITGIWVGKYESSSSSSSATNGNVTNMKVQIKPSVISWKDIQLANAFTVCENIKKTGGVIGNNSNEIDTHMMKNMEWGAVAILSQSKYGVFNPESTNEGQIWNNPRYKTGYAGSTKDADTNSAISEYNFANGPKASTTGTVYGIYDMAGGMLEYVMGLMEPSTNTGKPAVGYTSIYNTGFTGRLYDGTLYTGLRALPDSKYYDIYQYGTSNTDHIRGKIGDATSELNPPYRTTWNGDSASFVASNNPVFLRGGSAGGTYSTRNFCLQYLQRYQRW